MSSSARSLAIWSLRASMVLAMLSAPAVRPPATARAMAASERSFSTRKVAIASSMPAAVLAYMLTAATPAPATTPTPSSASVTGFAASTAASVTMAPLAQAEAPAPAHRARRCGRAASSTQEGHHHALVVLDHLAEPIDGVRDQAHAPGSLLRKTRALVDGAE